MSERNVWLRLPVLYTANPFVGFSIIALAYLFIISLLVFDVGPATFGTVSDPVPTALSLFLLAQALLLVVAGVGHAIIGARQHTSALAAARPDINTDYSSKSETITPIESMLSGTTGALSVNESTTTSAPSAEEGEQTDPDGPDDAPSQGGGSAEQETSAGQQQTDSSSKKQQQSSTYDMIDDVAREVASPDSDTATETEDASKQSQGRGEVIIGDRPKSLPVDQRPLAYPTPLTEYAPIYFAYFIVLVASGAGFALTYGFRRFAAVSGLIVGVASAIAYLTGGLSTNRVWAQDLTKEVYAGLRLTVTPRRYRLSQIYLVATSLLMPVAMYLALRQSLYPWLLIGAAAAFVPSAILAIGIHAGWPRSRLLTVIVVGIVSLGTLGATTVLLLSIALLRAPFQYVSDLDVSMAELLDDPSIFGIDADGESGGVSVPDMSIASQQSLDDTAEEPQNE